VTGNVGGTTKKIIASAVIFVGVAVGNIVGPYAFLESGRSETLYAIFYGRSLTRSPEAPRYTTGIIVCMASRIAEVCALTLILIITVYIADPLLQIIIILLLRLAFVLPNRLRDKKSADGDKRYDPNVTTYEDISDRENLHFRYMCE
jgi:hypothetical protein